MDGSGAPLARTLQQAKELSLHRMRSYDQERLVEVGTINLILCKPQPFMQQRRCERASEWLQQYFQTPLREQELGQLIEYYRFYRISPTIASIHYLDLMIGYWNKTKTVYYRKIKCELNLEKDQSVFSHSNLEATVGRESADGVDFELPSQLASFETTFLHDPDATLRHLLTSLACKQSYKEETREASRIGEFQQKSVQSHHLKTHIRTNPSYVASGSSLKKAPSKKKVMHKSLSNEPKSPDKTKHKPKMSNVASCQRIPSKEPESTLNYQRRNHKPKQGKKCKEVVQPKIRQFSMGKVKNHEKSEGKSSTKKLSSSKKKQAESTKVKVAISKARDKIKAEKTVILKRYMQQRESMSRSNEPKQSVLRRSRK